MLTAKELAGLLNGREYCREVTSNEEEGIKAAGLVVVFGASDDLMEFRGAIYDELDCCDGGIALVDADGLLPDRDNIENDDELQSYFVRKPNARTIEALWSAEPGYSWTYRTDIPHETFEIVEDGDPYCRGIVFALADLVPAPAEPVGAEPDVVPAAAGQDANEAKLTAIVRAFIEKHRISCQETIHQTDRVIENAYGLIEELCDVVGYHHDPDDDEG